MHIRHYGFLSNRSRKQKLDTIRARLQAPEPPSQDDDVQMIEAPPPSDTSTNKTSNLEKY